MDATVATADVITAAAAVGTTAATAERGFRPRGPRG